MNTLYIRIEFNFDEKKLVAVTDFLPLTEKKC